MDVLASRCPHLSCPRNTEIKIWERCSLTSFGESHARSPSDWWVEARWETLESLQVFMQENMHQNVQLCLGSALQFQIAKCYWVGLAPGQPLFMNGTSWMMYARSRICGLSPKPLDNFSTPSLGIFRILGLYIFSGNHLLNEIALRIMKSSLVCYVVQIHGRFG